MTKTIKTYGAEGYMDWVAQIPAGASKVKVHFTGGALTQYGVTPAEYTTDNPFFQRVIEGSQYYKDGRITTLRTVQVEEPQGTLSVQGTASLYSRLPQEGAAGQQAQQPTAPAQAPAPQSAEEAEEEAEGAEERTEGKVQVEVRCVQDAQEYLAEHYGIAARNVRSRAAIETAGAERGIEFIWE